MAHLKLGSPLARKIILFIIRGIMKLLLRFDVSGVDRLPRSGPLIIIINHIAFFDPVVCSRLPRLLTPIAKKEAFRNPFFAWVMNRYGVIPIARGEVDLHALKSALRVLKQGGTILLAPEGTRSPTGQLQRAKGGATMLALRSGAAVVPVGVTGTDRLQTHWRRGRRAPVCLSVGEAFRLRTTTRGRVKREEMERITEEVMYRLAAQLPPEYRGIYSDLEAATETAIVPLVSPSIPSKVMRT